MPDENKTSVHDEEEEISPISKLIWEVSQQPVLYDSQNPLYKDSSARLAAWHHVAREMKMPVTDCQIKWGTLRRCLANARKRQMKRQAGGSKFIKKWRYQDEMGFLLPFIDQREYEYISISSRKRKPSVKWTSFDYDSSSCTDPLSQSQDLFISEEYEAQSETDDSQTDTKPTTEKLQMFLVANASSHNPSNDSPNRFNPQHQQRQQKQQQQQQQPTSLISADEMYIEEDEIENIPVDPDPDTSLPHLVHHRRTHQKRNLPGEITLDEMDSFFLSMSKALKKLPRVEQINVRSQVYNLVTRAEMSWLQKSASQISTTKSTADS